MNVHNHSLWPPPGGADLNRLVLIVPVIRSPHDGHAAVIQPMDRG